mmetsp:Transcript_24393/g.67576  ORF Transcript_24393/g.67576 Transcript_24393/m.67576 type:complete len:1193 (-) Transcript_24393:65-3643(-)
MMLGSSSEQKTGQHKDGSRMGLGSNNKSTSEDGFSITDIDVSDYPDISQDLSESSLLGGAESKLEEMHLGSQRGTLTDDIKADVRMIAPSLERETSNKIREALPIGTLQFDRHKLHGREEQAEKLRDAMLRVKKHNNNSCDSDAATEFVLIDGASGSGKTVLATSIQDDVEHSSTGIYLQGKFDLTVREEPYTALATAFQDLCWRAEGILGQEAFEQFQADTVKNVDLLELRFLHGIIPSMGLIATLPELGNGNGYEDSMLSQEQTNRLLHGFVKFIRVACMAFSPLVIFLDDLQWADVSSLDLLKALISERVPTNVMVIGTYRSDEANPDLSNLIGELRLSDKTGSTRPSLLLSSERSTRHVLLASMASGVSRSSRLFLPSEAFGSSLVLTEISLGNLMVDDVMAIVMDLLALEDESMAVPLAQILHRRTLGNPNFLKTLMAVLYEDNLLSYNIGMMQWRWDLDEIEKSSFASDNVIDLTRRGIERNSSKEMHHLLLCVACLGSICEEKYIRLVWKKSNAGQTSERLLQQLLKQAVDQMFLERIGNFQFRYSHDAVKEAVISLIPRAEFDALLQQAGGILFKQLTEEELDTMLFLVADLLHNSDWTNNKLSHLLLRAARKAKGVLAFSSASFYALHGIKRMPQSWVGDENIQLAVKLHSIAAEAERSLGNLSHAKLLCDTIIKQNHLPLFDKLKAHKILIDMLIHKEDNFDVSLEYTLDLMGKTVGLHFPRSKVGQGLAALRAIKQMKMEKTIPSSDEIENLPMMTDPMRMFGIELLQAAGFSAFFGGKPILMLLTLNQRIQWSLKHGFHPSMPAAFATMSSVFMHVMKDWEQGRRLAAASHQLLENAKACGRPCSEGEVIVRLYMLVDPWTRPARSLSNYYIDGYKTCMLQGDVDSAFKVISTYMLNGLLSGKELKYVEEDAQRYQSQMAALKYDKWEFLLGLLSQASLNLMGRAENTITLTGKAVEEPDDPGLLQHYHHTHFVVRFLCAHFGEYKAGAQDAIQIGHDWEKKYPGFLFGYDAFHKAICLYGEARVIAQLHRNRCNLLPPVSRPTSALCKKHAYKYHAMIQSWVKSGAPNHVHHLSILDAEKSALLSSTQKGDFKEVCQLYEKSIRDSVRGGFVNHAALAEERYASYLVEIDSKDEGLYHLQNAIERFSDWGANRRAEQLRAKLGMLTRSSMAGIAPLSME